VAKIHVLLFFQQSQGIQVSHDFGFVTRDNSYTYQQRADLYTAIAGLEVIGKLLLPRDIIVVS